MERNTITNKKELIKEYQRMTEENDCLIIKTINKTKRIQGVASVCKNGKVMIFEGNPDGSDDKAVSIDEFIKNYQFFLDTEI